MSNYTIGIDPGKTGAIVALDGYGAIAFSGTRDDVVRLLREYEDDIQRVYVERQHAIHGQGLSSTFTLAQDYGEILGALKALVVPFDLARAQDWQKVMLRGEPKASGVDLKRQYVAVAERLWPSISFRGLRGGIIDGKAAAALIAEYGRRLFIR